MRHSLIIPGMLVSAVLLGGLLYLYGGPTFTEPIATEQQQSNGDLNNGSFETVAKGSQALDQDRRTNYRIKSIEEFSALWEMVYSNNGPSIPIINFDREEVIAVFDGSHSTTGYAIDITDITDAGGVRTVTIARTQPGEQCDVSTRTESPFHIVRISKSGFPLIKKETLITSQCQ